MYFFTWPYQLCSRVVNQIGFNPSALSHEISIEIRNLNVLETKMKSLGLSRNQNRLRHF